MQKSSHPFGIRREFFLSFSALIILAAPIAFSATHAASIQSQPPSRITLAKPSDFRFDVVSIKPTKTPDGGWHLNPTSDGITGRNVPLVYLVHQAYGIYEDYRYPGAPKWLNSENYDIDAKMEGSVLDEYRKLTRSQRALADRQMLQSLLSERFNLQVHRETKEFPVFFLVIAKNGPKLQESKPNPDDPNAPKNAVWSGGGMKAGVITTTAKLMPIGQLASVLSRTVGRVVLDKTGLTGTYDFTLNYAPDQNAAPPSGDASEAQPATPASDPNGTSIFTALQDQLGLKLESTKGPIEVIVIDHIERPSGN